jgi:hypothetical protein
MPRDRPDGKGSHSYRRRAWERIIRRTAAKGKLAQMTTRVDCINQLDQQEAHEHTIGGCCGRATGFARGLVAGMSREGNHGRIGQDVDRLLADGG